MFKNYLVLTWRNIKRNWGGSFVKIVGLAVGIAACLLILLWVKDELGFNRYHENVDNIYLVVSERVSHRGEYYYTTPVFLAESLRHKYPEISMVVRFQFRKDVIAKRGEKVFTDWQGAYIDPEVFEAFTFPFLRGNAKSAFLNLNNVVLTKTAAQKLFGGTDPIGQIIEIEGKLVEVMGILRDIPKNSDIQVDYFRPFLSMEELTRSESFLWSWFSCDTYVVLRKEADPVFLHSKISGLLNTNRSWSTSQLDVSLFPFKDRHLHTPAGGGPIKYIYIFIAVAIMIMLIACINFVNLSTAKSAMRAKEIGIRKVFGAKRSQLIKQFFLESMLFAVLSAIIAILLAFACVPVFDQLARKQLRFDLSDPVMILGLIGMVIIAGIVAGSYPALVLSSFQPVKILKNNFLPYTAVPKRASLRRARFRQGTVITQFFFSIGLIVCALVVFKQLFYMRNADMGFKKENLVMIKIPEQYKDKYEILKVGLAQSKNIVGVTCHGLLNYGGAINWDNASGDMQYLGANTTSRMVDFDYISTYKMEIVSGRDFSKDFLSDFKNAYLINEEAVERWDFKDPVDKRFSFFGAPGKIVGVYKNERFGLKNRVMPCVLYLSPKTEWDRFNHLTLRLRADHVMEALEDIKKTWKVLFADIPIEYRYVDEMIDTLYQSEERLSGLINVFTVLAIVISCLGLFSMASYMAQQKTKEIGIRKVLGASVSRIIFLMTKETIRCIIIASLLAWPLAFLVMRSWLNNYPYRIRTEIWVFLISGLAALLLTMMSVIYQAINSAAANPVDSLRYE